MNRVQMLSMHVWLTKSCHGNDQVEKTFVPEEPLAQPFLPFSEIPVWVTGFEPAT